MKKFATILCSGFSAPLRFFLLGSVISSCMGITTSTADGKFKMRRTSMHKVLLTQKGYIQFLRWELPVPEFEEFTFCLWVESNDLTHPHSIFSYSKNERDRLVRSWISSHGRSVHLEIGGTEVFAAATEIREGRWYHVCQSWENQAGRYALWIDGRVWVQGHSEKTINHVIPSGGDIVLGQEYTDFDKGLEEGIEGAVLGFNLLLASSFNPLFASYGEATQDASPSFSVSNYDTILPFFARIPLKIMQPDIEITDPAIAMPYASLPSLRGRRTVETVDPYRRPTSLFLRGRTARASNFRHAVTAMNYTRNLRDVSRVTSVPRRPRIKIGASKVQEEPLGLQLIKLSYVRCEIGRGSPFIGGPLMLISWTRTPVRVFGGATLKNARDECGNF